MGWLALRALLALVHLAPSPAHAAPPVAASVPYAVSQTGAGNSHLPVFSADGRHVAFVSQANNLVTNDDLGPWLDLFVRGLVTSNIVMVSVSTNGFGGANADVGVCSLSSNAQVIAFETVAGNLTPADTNFASDIFVRNLAAGTTELVSTSAFGSGNGPSFNPLVSADGRYVIFESLASNLVTNDFNGTNDIFLRDLVTGTTVLISVDAAGHASAAGPSREPSISASGLFVAFVSQATNVVAGVTNRAGEVYVRDVVAGSNRWATASHIDDTRDAMTGAYAASQPTLSDDGRHVAFKTPRALVRFDTARPAHSIVEAFPNPPGPANIFSFRDNPRIGLHSPRGFTPGGLAASRDGRYVAGGAETNDVGGRVASVFRVDFDGLETNVAVKWCCEGAVGGPQPYFETSVVPSLVIVSTNFAGDNPGAIRSITPAISADGQRVAFVSDAANEPGGTTNGQFRLYLRDLASNGIQTVSTRLDGGPGFVIPDIVPVLSPDGARVAWESQDEELVASDLNRSSDVFVQEIDSGAPQPVSARHVARPAATSIRLASAPLLSADGRRVAFLASDGNTTPGDTNLARDLFVHDRATGTNVAIGFGVMVPPDGPTNASPILVTPQYAVGAPQFSGDGRYVVFLRRPALPNPFPTNVYRADAASGEVDRVLRVPPGNAIESAAVSFDGRLVAFATREPAGVFVPTGPVEINGNQPDIFLRDFANPDNPFQLISVNHSNTATGISPSINPVISPDSRWVAFQSLAKDITPEAVTSTSYQLFARDLSGNLSRLISYQTTAPSAPDGRSLDLPLPGGGSNALFSANGRYLFFAGATNVIYRHDLLHDAVLTVTQDGGTSFTNTARLTNVVVCADCASPTVSADGRFVAYESPAAGPARQIFVRDLFEGTSQLMSVTSAGPGGNGPSTTPLLSHDARFIVFASQASDLTANDTNRARDMFVRDRLAGFTLCLTLNAAGMATGNRVSSSPALSADGRTVAFQSFASDLVPGDYNDTRDVFIVSLTGPDTDGDGMDDDWEVAYFNTMARNGTGDFDGDGADDLAEFRAGTDPTNTGSILRVLTVTTAASSATGQRTTVLLWSASPGRRYRAQAKSTVDIPWMDLPGEVVAAGTTATLTETSADLEAARFYRVVVVP